MFKKNFKKIRDWSNANQGLLMITTIVLMILPLVFNLSPNDKSNFKGFSSAFDFIIGVLLLKIEIPIFVLVLFLFVAFIYWRYVKRKYVQKKVTLAFLEGDWKNEWTVGGTTYTEKCHISKDGKYIVNDYQCFNIEDFKYDFKSNEISFIKVSVPSVGNRRLPNFLSMKNNDLIIGREEDYNIKYSRLQ